MRGTIGGAPICLPGIVGFATVAIGVGPFLCLSYHLCVLILIRFAVHPSVNPRKAFQPCAANFLELTTYASRQAMEQKCNTSSPSRMGIESDSSTCMPQTGSRTNRRAVLAVCAEPDASPGCREPEPAFCSSEPKARRSSDTLQEITSSQNKNRKMRAKKVMGAKDSTTALVPPESQ